MPTGLVALVFDKLPATAVLATNKERHLCADVATMRAAGLTAESFSPALRDALLRGLFAAPSELLLLPMQDIFGWRAVFLFRLPIALALAACGGSDDGADAGEVRMFPHLVTAGLAVHGKSRLAEICAQLADLARHLATPHPWRMAL